MEKNNNKSLYAILGGVVACFVCIGMVFLYPSNNNKNYSSERTIRNGFLQSLIDYSLDDDIALGDTGTCNNSGIHNSDQGCLQIPCGTIQSQDQCQSITGSTGGNCCSWSSGGGGGTPAPVITCSNLTYNGNSQLIASCSGGSITSPSGGMVTNAGTYNVVCSNSSTGVSATASCTLGKASTSISNFADFDLEVIDVKTLSATANSGAAITYTSSDSNIASINGATITGVSVGTVQITASVGATSNYNAATKTINVTVSASCPAGQGFDSYSTGCSNCAAGKFSDANDNKCQDCPTGTYSGPGASRADCKPISAPCCVDPYGSPVTKTDLNDCKAAVENEMTVLPNACPEQKTITRVDSDYTGTLYLNKDEYNGYGFYTVKYTAYDQNGKVIMPHLIEWTVNASNRNVIVSGSETTDNTSFYVTYKGLGCYQSPVPVSVTAKAKVTVGVGSVTSQADSSQITIDTDHEKWSEQNNWNGIKTDSQILLEEGHASGQCVAVSDPYVDDEGVTRYHKKHNRCCGNSDSNPTPPPTAAPTPTPSPTPTAPPSGKIPYCYYDETDEPVWTDSPKSSWKKVEGVTKKEDCKKEEEPACYIDLKGDYVWGKHAKDAGYQVITSIKNSEDCHKPTGEYACYKNTAGDYKWSKTPIDGYEKVPEIKTPAECSAPETPACYVAPSGKYVWGKYNTIKGYIIMVGLSEKECNAPEKKACYIAPDGKYVWGEYGNDSRYKLVVSVTEEKQCINDVPTPKTDSNVSRIIYVFVAILMVSGLVFIYYSNATKKQNN